MRAKESYDAVVVGSGPNGLAAAITLSRAGRSILVLEAKSSVGGGMRSSSTTLPGFVHDICSSVHPMGVASPFFKSLDLPSHGVEWIYSPASLAHPLDDGSAVVLERSPETTAATLGVDRASYLHLMRPLADAWERLADDILSPLHFPHSPFLFARFGLRGVSSIDGLIHRNFRGTSARALFAGIAAHSTMSTRRMGGAAYGIALAVAGHAVGWPIVKGGSSGIAGALMECLIASGGKIRTGAQVRSLDDLPPSRALFMDVTPRQLAEIASSRLHARYLRLLSHYAYGPGVFKVDWALDDAIPWMASGCKRAATIHLGGTYEEISEAENSLWSGEHPERPFVILGQPSLFDPSLAPEGKHTAWAYCHVPNASVVDMSHSIEAQVERFAPGFRRRILARHVQNTRDLESYNANYVGGDIAGGRQDPLKTLLRPVGRWRPYATPLKGMYLCSSSMPPGPGVHGMCGYHAARRAIADGF